MILIFELKKFFRQKNIIICIVLFLILNIYNIYTQSSLNDKSMNMFNAASLKFYTTIEGHISPEKIQFISEYSKQCEKDFRENQETIVENSKYYTGFAYGDMNMAQEHLNEISRLLSYASQSNEWIKEAKSNINYYDLIDNQYMKKTNEEIVNIYNGRYINEYYKTDGFCSLLNYNFSSLLIFLLIILYASQIFVSEKESGMYELIMTTEHRNVGYVLTKLKSLILYCVFLTVMFYIVDLISFYKCYYLRGFDLPLYAVNGFEKTPLNIKIWQYILLSFFINLLGYFLISLICSYISIISKNGQSAIIIAFIVFALLICLNSIEVGKIQNILDFNPLKLLQIQNLFASFKALNFFGAPIPYYFFILVINLVISFIFSWYIIKRGVK